MTKRLNEAIKQTRIGKEEVDDPEVLEELEQALEALQNAVEALEDED
jgi:ribosomal protein L1